MKAITIRVVTNGYTAHENHDDALGLVGDTGTYIFETFGSLVSWLGKQLDPIDEEKALENERKPREWIVVIDHNGYMGHYTDKLRKGWSRIKVSEVIAP